MFLDEPLDQFAMASSVHWNGHYLSKEYDCVFRMALELEVEGQTRKWMKRMKGMWKWMEETG